MKVLTEIREGEAGNGGVRKRQMREQSTTHNAYVVASLAGMS